MRLHYSFIGKTYKMQKLHALQTCLRSFLKVHEIYPRFCLKLEIFIWVRRHHSISIFKNSCLSWDARENENSLSNGVLLNFLSFLILNNINTKFWKSRPNFRPFVKYQFLLRIPKFLRTNSLAQITVILFKCVSNFIEGLFTLYHGFCNRGQFCWLGYFNDTGIEVYRSMLFICQFREWKGS